MQTVRPSPERRPPQCGNETNLSSCDSRWQETRKFVVSTCMTRVFHNRLKSSSTFRVSRRGCSTSKTTANSRSSPRPIFAVPLPDLLSLASCERIFRWWPSAVCLFRHCFPLRDWGVPCGTFPGRFGFSATCTLGRGSPLRRRATFDACPALSCGTSLGRRPPFSSGAALYLRPFFPGLALGRRTFFTLHHMLPV